MEESKLIKHMGLRKALLSLQHYLEENMDGYTCYRCPITHLTSSPGSNDNYLSARIRAGNRGFRCLLKNMYMIGYEMADISNKMELLTEKEERNEKNNDT